jgi:predicted DNA-binding transcriptional regulator YafY
LHPSQQEATPGSFTLNVALTKDFISALLSFGPSLEVISPSALRERLKALAAEVVGLY